MLESLDIKTLVLVLSLGHAIAALLLFFDTRKRPALRYDVLFMTGMGLQSVAWALIYLRDAIPDVLSFSTGNVLMFAGICLEGFCLLSLVRPIDRNWRIFYASIFVILLVVWWVSDASTNAITIGITGFIIVFFFIFPALFLIFFSPRPSPLQKFIGVTILVYLIAVIIRGVSIIMAGNYSLTLPVFYQVGFLLFQILEMALVSTGYILIRKEFTNADLEQDIAERKHTEKKLRESEEKYRKLFEQSNDAILIADAVTRTLTDCNRKAEELTGYSRSELLTMRADDLHPPEIRAAVMELFRDFIQGKASSVDTEILMKSGKHVPVSINAGPVEIEENVFLIGIFRDNTHHVLEERYTSGLSRLKQELLITAPLEEKLRKITDACINLFDADFARIWITGPGDLCDQGCAHALAVSETDACKDRSSCLHLIVSSGRYTHTDGSHRRVPFGAYKIGRIANGEIARFITNDVAHDPRVHDHAWAVSLGLVSFSGFRLLSADGKPVGVLAFFSRQPVTADMEKYLDDLATTTSQIIMTTQAEEALRESEEKYRTIIDNMQDMVYRTDNEGRFTMISPSGARLIGYTTPDQLLGLNINTHWEDPEKREKFMDIIRKNGSVTGYPINIRSFDGTVHHVIASSHIYRDKNGVVQGVEGVVHDITDLRHAEEGLRLANKKLHLLSSITRHDIRNQLMGLRGYLHMSSKSLDDKTKLAEYLAEENKIAITIDRQISFTKDYENMGIKSPAFQSVDVCLSKAVSALSMKDIHVENTTSGLEIYADPLLEKVFYNLFDNALRYGGEKMTTIRCTFRQEEKSLVLVIEDDGVGIAPEDKAHLFEKGYGKNTGFGLFLAREILAITGITIMENGDRGARFAITVPEGSWRFTTK